MHSTRAKVKVFVDGTDATDGVELIINDVTSENSLELTRFIVNCNLTTGNRFKFIEKTSQIEDHCDIRAEDGLIRIEWEYEKVVQVISIFPLSRPKPWLPPYNPNQPYVGTPINNPAIYFATCQGTGITVLGSVSTQSFLATLGFETDGNRHAIILKLMGENRSDKPINIPITVKTKQKCQTCGKMGLPTNNVCSTYGTSLKIF